MTTPIALKARPIDRWPGQLLEPHQRENPRFSATWSDTVELLTREIGALTAGPDTEVVVQLAVGERDLRLDGWIRADARPAHPGVILSFKSVHGPLRYSTDQFTSATTWHAGHGQRTMPGWQANIRAIALGLEALRKVDRYGIARGGEQYRGWNALPPGASPTAADMTVDEAARLLTMSAGKLRGVSTVEEVAAAAHELWREAAKVHHPDVGGDPAMFRRLTEARDLLDRTVRR